MAVIFADGSSVLYNSLLQIYSIMQALIILHYPFKLKKSFSLVDTNQPILFFLIRFC